ncbi:sensor histidine kinase [uncultured Parasphingorhabdus sp.]|uniref:sensor histidine kinase n=1 Tax=uncultured Parasphingorhabdus sp. TaxID=2709694 RepID=UPI0030D94BFA|tara:strand:+ start:64034 stop:65068 length:1035 start_codon:yes stop_codon:yes gene_type:complete
MFGLFNTDSLARINRLDLVDLTPRFPPLIVQIIVAVTFSGIAIAAREIINSWADGAGPFVVNVPFILLATLFGRFRAGLLALLLTTVYSWYYVLPFTGSFSFEAPGDGARTLVNAAIGLIIVCLGDAARTTGRWLLLEKEQHIAERDMLLAEVDHRVKNNLAILSSLLSLQQRKSDNIEVISALGRAAGRVQSLSKAYESLRYDNLDNIAIVDMRDFLNRLCGSLREALTLDGRIKLVVVAEPCQLSRDRAGAVGLLVNELVTNAVKHAFVDREKGTIKVELLAVSDGAVLEVSDDGVGLPDIIRDGAQGTQFLSAFAQMAKGELDSETGEYGTRYICRLEDTP